MLNLPVVQHDPGAAAGHGSDPDRLLAGKIHKNISRKGAKGAKKRGYGCFWEMRTITKG